MSSSISSSSSRLRNRNPSSENLNLIRAKAALSSLKAELKQARLQIYLVRAPFTTLRIFAQCILEWLTQSIRFLLSHHTLLYTIISVFIFGTLAYVIEGEHQYYVQIAEVQIYFILWWIGLGILSSVGLGTGLHTFVLYLGPHIATVTLAVTECNTLAVATSGPHALKCPDAYHHEPGDLVAGRADGNEVTIAGILWKVAFACFLWGAGTAIGELPPYYVARAAALSGQKLAELDELDDTQGHPPSTAMDKVKLQMYNALQKFGFGAIVLFASIPNPLFDLAGLTCGHFLIPFWTFFGATFIGKAIVKVQIQAIFVILAFSKDRLTHIIEWIESSIPYIEGTLKGFFEKQRQIFHLDAAEREKQAAEAELKNGNWAAWAWNWLLIGMLLFFVKSIVDSSVQEKLAIRDQIRIEKFKQENNIVDEPEEEQSATSSNGQSSSSSSSGDQKEGSDSKRR